MRNDDEPEGPLSQLLLLDEFMVHEKLFPLPSMYAYVLTQTYTNANHDP